MRGSGSGLPVRQAGKRSSPELQTVSLSAAKASPKNFLKILLTNRRRYDRIQHVSDGDTNKEAPLAQLVEQ